jgi:hypothetical protein
MLIVRQICSGASVSTLAICGEMLDRGLIKVRFLPNKTGTPALHLKIAHICIAISYFKFIMSHIPVMNTEIL